jgi:hypothetical protein
MIEPIFVLPIGVGLAVFFLSFVLFKQGGISPRYFAIALLLSMALVFSPIIFNILEFVKQLFGIRFTFVLGFGIANVITLSLLVYLVLVIGRLRNEIVTLWQEIALVKSELDDSDLRNDDQ